jgi:hypothetical protein
MAKERCEVQSNMEGRAESIPTRLSSSPTACCIACFSTLSFLQEHHISFILLASSSPFALDQIDQRNEPGALIAELSPHPMLVEQTYELFEIFF